MRAMRGPVLRALKDLNLAKMEWPKHLQPLRWGEEAAGWMAGPAPSFTSNPILQSQEKPRLKTRKTRF